MVRDELADASDELRSAAEDAADDVAERLQDQADQVRDLAEREFDPDHGTLARVETKLNDLGEEGSVAVEQRVEAALERIREFREGVDGV